MDLLSQLEAHEEVIALYSQLRTLQEYNHIQVARLLRAAGAVELARVELTQAGPGSQFTSEDERERFRLELQWGSAEQVVAAYQEWRDLGWEEDILGINRFAVFVRDPFTPWRARDLLGPLGFIAALGALALLCVVPIAGVHYRGLAVRARSGEAYPTQGSRLLHAWLALFCFAAASVLALYSAGSIDLVAEQAGNWGVDATPPQLARITLVEALFALALLLPVAAVVNARHSPWWGAQWSIAKICVVGVALGLAFRIPLLLLSAARPETVPSVAPDDALWQVIGAMRETYGVAAALWILVVAAPVVEELVFRGALYRAFAVHIRPGWANVLQAALFSAMHLNLRAAVLLFALGLVLGTLARRSGGLLAPMVMHAVFNLVAALMFLW
jgi:membrane protease YdiL (CAAX protease family)